MSDPFVKCILASISETGIPIYTFHMRYWRGIHSEIMTHRVFSRNARSSRAVPVNKMLEEIRNDPFIPRHWGKNQKGMQADEECHEPLYIEGACHFDMIDNRFDSISREEAWLYARDQAVKVAAGFSEAGYHKQVANRLLEPFMWIDTLVTSTQWSNFFALRDHKDAEPHFRDLAQLTKEAMDAAELQHVKKDHWHLPYITDDDIEEIVSTVQWNHVDDALCKISAARCARISYAPFDGDSSLQKEFERAKLLLNNPVHASPFEHQAKPDQILFEKINVWDERVWCEPEKQRNLYGWIQNRAMIKNETVQDKFKV